MLVFGSQIMSFMTETTNMALRLIKNSSLVSRSLLRFEGGEDWNIHWNPSHCFCPYTVSICPLLGLRHHREVLRHGRPRAFGSFAQRCLEASEICPDGQSTCLAARSCRGQSCSTERENARLRWLTRFRFNAVQALLVIHSHSDSIRTVSDVEQIVTPCIKSLDSADYPTRRSLARLVAQVLALTQVERAVATAEKKGRKDTAENSSEMDRPSGPVVEATKALLSVPDMLSQLAVHFNKFNVSRKTRIGIFDFYAATLSQLGTAFIETHYATVIKHIMSELISSTRSGSTHYETLLVRKLTGVLLRDLVGTRLLTEQGQIEAIKELSSSYLRRWPALMPGQSPPAPNVIIVALKEVAGLLQQLGNAPPPVQVCFTL